MLFSKIDYCGEDSVDMPDAGVLSVLHKNNNYTVVDRKIQLF